MTWHPYDLTSIWFGNFIPRKFCFSGQNIVFNLDSSLSIAQLVCLQILKLYSWPTTEVHVIHILKHIDLNNCMYIYMYKHIWKLTNIPFIGKADTRVLRRQHLSQKEMSLLIITKSLAVINSWVDQYNGTCIAREITLSYNKKRDGIIFIATCI